MLRGTSSAEPRRRSIAKAISYRMIGTATTALLAWLVTGDAGTALTIGALEPVFKMAMYYLHERTWQYVPYGLAQRMP